MSENIGLCRITYEIFYLIYDLYGRSNFFGTRQERKTLKNILQLLEYGLIIIREIIMQLIEFVIERFCNCSGLFAVDVHQCSILSTYIHTCNILNLGSPQ